MGKLRGGINSSMHSTSRPGFFRLVGGRPCARTPLNKPWRDGCRNSQMTKMLVSMTVVDGVIDGVVPDDPKAPIAAAVDYIEQCLAAHMGRKGRIFSALAKRLARLRAQLDAPARPPRDPEKAVNLRAPHATMLMEPLRNAAVPGNPEKKRGRGRSKGSKNKKRGSAIAGSARGANDGQGPAGSNDQRDTNPLVDEGE